MSYKNIHPFQPGLRTIYVNHTSGNDGYAGTISEPVGTIQEAVNRFKPLDRGVQAWDLNDDRTIIVQDPGGTSTFDEEIVIPPHAGEGALVIKAEYHAEFSGLVESGSPPFSAISGFEVRQRLSFTTSPLTPSTLGDGYIIIPDANLLGEPYSFSWDYLPIVDNAAGTCDVVAIDPGIWTAYSHGNGTEVSIVRPIVTWRPPSNSFFYPNSCIRNMGGSLIVEGFVFENSSSSSTNYIISNTGYAGDILYGGKVHIRGCIVNNNGSGAGFQTLFNGDSISACGIIIKSKGAYTTHSKNLSMVNCRDVIPSGVFYRNILNSTALALYGLDLDATNATSAGLSFEGCNQVDYLMLDIRGSGLYLYKTNTVQIWAMSCEDSGTSPCIDIAELSSAYLVEDNRVVGSSGNTGYGIRLRGINSSLYMVYTSSTISGSSGDIKVGSNPVISWSNTIETDVSYLCVFISI